MRYVYYRRTLRQAHYNIVKCQINRVNDKVNVLMYCMDMTPTHKLFFEKLGWLESYDP